MAAVIGIVSLILVIVAAVTSATLGTTLESRLDEQVRTAASDAARWTNSALVAESFRPTAEGVTAAKVLSGRWVPPGLVLIVAQSAIAPDGATVLASGETSDTGGSIEPLTDAEMAALAQAADGRNVTTATLEGRGSYRITTVEGPGAAILIGLPRTDNQRTLAALFTTITLATLGGLLLLALTTAITIRMSLRPLREVSAIATRVAGQRLDEGAVQITERVPEEHADPRTETGAVGASLNVLLDHVDSSLASRQQKEEQMRRFVADASHELRTPLASIRGYSELTLKAIERAVNDEEGTRTALERIQAQSLRMTRLVEDLLLLARLDEGAELVYTTVDIAQLALEGIADAQPTGPDHLWNVDVPDGPVIVLGDSGRLHQVVTNLLANARTHTPAGTTVTVTVESDADAAVLRVHDDGPGIDPELAEDLFSRFARGDASRARQTGGTGLGLAIVKAIVEGHGGTITVASTPGDTTFTVRLPHGFGTQTVPAQ